MTAPLRRIQTLTAQLEAFNAERDMAVSRALTVGATWAEVAA